MGDGPVAPLGAEPLHGPSSHKQVPPSLPPWPSRALVPVRRPSSGTPGEERPSPQLKTARRVILRSAGRGEAVLMPRFTLSDWTTSILPVPLPPAWLRAGPWPPAQTTARWLLNSVQGCPQRSIFGAPQTSRLETWVRGDASRAKAELVRHAPQPPGRQDRGGGMAEGNFRTAKTLPDQRARCTPPPPGSGAKRAGEARLA
jgi:hypothetical protein